MCPGAGLAAASGTCRRPATRRHVYRRPVANSAIMGAMPLSMVLRRRQAPGRTTRRGRGPGPCAGRADRDFHRPGSMPVTRTPEAPAAEGGRRRDIGRSAIISSAQYRRRPSRPMPPRRLQPSGCRRRIVAPPRHHPIPFTDSGPVFSLSAPVWTPPPPLSPAAIPPQKSLHDFSLLDRGAVVSSHLTHRRCTSRQRPPPLVGTKSSVITGLYGPSRPAPPRGFPDETPPRLLPVLRLSRAA